MDRDMLILAERLVIAMETMSQDVRNMSAYVYDISCSVSYLVNERREKESTSVAADVAGQEVPAERNYSRQHEHADERSSSFIGDQEHEECSFGAHASMCIDPHENLDVHSSESNSVFTGGIKIEEQSDGDVNDESCYVHNKHGHSRNVNKVYTTLLTCMPQEQVKTNQMESADKASVVYTRVNREEKHPKCSVWRKSFMSHSALQNHTGVHTGERPYKCNICGSAFTENGNLSRHMRSHSGERPYSCNVCGKAFTRNNHLTIHMRLHTGEKPYNCNLCGKPFRHSNSLEYHMRTHSRKDPN